MFHVEQRLYLSRLAAFRTNVPRGTTVRSPIFQHSLDKSFPPRRLVENLFARLRNSPKPYQIQCILQAAALPS